MSKNTRPGKTRSVLGWISASCATAVLVAACSGEPPPPPAKTDYGPRPPMPDTAAQTGAQRLTVAQYGNAIRDIFGSDINVPTSIEADAVLDGFVAIGASVSTISPSGVEKYEKSAFAIAKQVIADDAHKAVVLQCKPTGADDAVCAQETVTRLGRLVYRRSLTGPEITRFTTIFLQAAAALGGFDHGLEYAIAAMLQSPHFLYRPQVGEADPATPGQLRYTSLEMASRLSFFLWNSTPDDALLNAAAKGYLVDDLGLAEEIDRMLASPKAHDGLRAFVTDWLKLRELDNLNKDPTLFTYFSPELGPAAREETLRLFEHIVFELDTDIRDIVTTRQTFVNPKLASMYMILSPEDEGFSLVEFPSDSPRVGLLGHVSILALNSHPRSTSSTLRGKFIRESLLCDVIPPPPANVNTGLPEPSPTARTLRERMQPHLQDPVCKSCHTLMDPIGLGLENFDSIGRYRTKEVDAIIDASGNLDGVNFKDARALAKVIHDSDKFAPCIVRKVFSYATGFRPTDGDRGALNTLHWDFRAAGYRLQELMKLVAMSPAFRLAQTPQ
ncbi:MAG TPA: DUF1592 domain-containing protein [Polyangium sp.]|nr:DUF1592 domain-containing protein [Polyangium sp.]